ncbi:phosphoserine phosphatase SerB [Arcanobacterium haemolyticum]|nr:phosphoserine phosphatase SerB [Arcanobacterium haemolyticum]
MAQDIRDELRGPAIALGVDCALTTGELACHGPGLVITDVDSTFIRGEVIEMLAAHAGSEELVAEITASAMRGEVDFAESLVRRVATLEGVSQRAAREIAGNVQLTPGAEALVRTLHSRGSYIGLVSGGFHEVVDLVGERVGVDRVLANRLGVRSGIFTGEVSGPIVERTTKAEALRRWSQELDVNLSRTIAVGDGANDLDMMAAAGLSVAFCAKPVVLEQADSAITQPRLDEVLAFAGWDAAERRR